MGKGKVNGKSKGTVLSNLLRNDKSERTVPLDFPLMARREDEVKKRIKGALAAGVSVGLIYLFFYLSGIGCPIKFLTGISCMGCGMTRAYLALLHLDLKGAFSYHPLFFLAPVLAVLIFFEEKIPRRVFRILIFTMIAAFSIIYVVRLLDEGDAVVVFEPESGLIYKVLSFIVGGL